MEVRVHERLEREPWLRFLATQPGATPFHGPAWNEAYAKHFGVRPYVVAAYDQGELVGLYPARRNGAVVRALASGPSDYLAPLGVFAQDREVLISALRPLGLVWDEGQSTEGEFEHAKCLQVSLPATFEEYVATLSKSLRTDIRRGLENPRIAFAARPDWDTFFRLHRLRWKDKHLPGAFLRRHEAFHREFAAASTEAELLELTLDGVPVGMIYLLHSPGTTFYYQAGMDPSANRFSPGTLLVATAIRQAIERGQHSFDFCRGDEPYKRRWKPDRITVNRRALRPLRPSGKPLVPYLTLTHRAEVAIKAQVEGGWNFSPFRKQTEPKKR